MPATPRRRLSLTLIAAPLLASLALSVAACSSGGRFNPGPTRTTQERSEAFPVDFEQWGKLGYRLDWKGYPALTGAQPVIDLLITPDAVVALEAGSTVTILEGTTGGLRASTQLASPLTRFLGLARRDNRVLVASEADLFTLDPQTANLVARQAFPEIMSGPPVASGAEVILGTVNGEMMALIDAGAAGSIKRWGFALGGSIDQPAAIVGGAAAAVSQNGDVVFVDARSGALLGRNRIFGGIATRPATNGRFLYVASLDQSLYAFSPEGGRQVWRHRTAAPLRTQPAAFGDRVWCATEEGGLTAFDATSGRVIWSVRGFMGTVVAVRGERVLAFDGAELRLINGRNGDIIERVAQPGVAYFRSERLDGTDLYAVSTSGVVGKFVAR